MVPQSQTIPLKKYSLKKFFWNGRMVGKQKFSTRDLRIHNWQVLYSQYRCVTELLADYIGERTKFNSLA